MAGDLIFASYDLHSDVAANRPVTPSTGGGRLYIFAATDTHVISIWDGAQWVSFAGSPTVNTLPTRQVLTSGSAATYTTPAGCRQLRIRFIAGGGGGAGSGNTGGGGSQTDGANTIFNGINVSGGKQGSSAGSSGAGGKSGSGTASVRGPGEAGGNGAVFNVAPGALGTPGTLGGGSAFLGGGGDSSAGIVNTGGGGGGGFLTVGNAGNEGGGGGGGESAELIINSPAATYTYTIGAGGTAGAAGTNGTVGFAGGSGVIIVDEYY